MPKMKTKSSAKKRFKFLGNGKVKRTGRTYFEVAYFTNHWHYKEFDTRAQAKEFISTL